MYMCTYGLYIHRLWTQLELWNYAYTNEAKLLKLVVSLGNCGVFLAPTGTQRMPLSVCVSVCLAS